MWKVYYRGVPKVCYRCLKEGHLGRDCEDTNPVNMEALVTTPEFEAAPVETEQDGEAVPKTFAQVVKDKSFTAREAQLQASRQLAAQVRQEAVAAARLEREKRDEERRRRRQEKEEIGERSFSLERGKSGGYGSAPPGDEDEIFSQAMAKRQHPSPLLKDRVNKAAKISDNGDIHGDVAGGAPPGHPQSIGGDSGGAPPLNLGKDRGRAVPPGN